MFSTQPKFSAGGRGDIQPQAVTFAQRKSMGNKGIFQYPFFAGSVIFFYSAQRINIIPERNCFISADKIQPDVKTGVLRC
jgi:hypothetical protein